MVKKIQEQAKLHFSLVELNQGLCILKHLG